LVQMGHGSHRKQPRGLGNLLLHLAFPPLVLLWPRPRREKSKKHGKQIPTADFGEQVGWSRQTSGTSTCTDGEVMHDPTRPNLAWLPPDLQRIQDVDMGHSSEGPALDRACSPLSEDCSVEHPLAPGLHGWSAGEGEQASPARRRAGRQPAASTRGGHQHALGRKSRRKDPESQPRTGTHTPNPKDGRHEGSAHRSVPAFRPVLAVSLVFLALFRFASDPTIGAGGNEDFVILTFQAPPGFGPLVALFWAFVLGALVLSTFFSRRPGCPRKPIREIVVPEIGALLLFFIADCMLEVVRIIDDDMNFNITLEGIWRSSGPIAAMLRRRWFIANFGLLMSITIVESLAPPRGSGLAIVFDAGWLAILAQAVSLFLHHSICRRESLQRWGSTFAAALYGLSLYLFTHSVALVSAIVFRKHEGVHRPPNVSEVCRLLVQDDPLRNTLAIAGFVMALTTVAVAPALFDWDLLHNHVMERGMLDELLEWAGGEWGHHRAVPESSYAVWLQAVSLGLCSGPHATAALSLVNVVALLAALRCTLRNWGARPAHAQASWEAELTIATGCLASLCWWALLFPAGFTQVVWWQRAGRALGAFTHIMLAAFSADVFAGRQGPVWYETSAVTFWAAFQVLQGLATEHHACMCHEDGHSPAVGALLVHGGEFGLCEFGLITTLGWVTYAAEHVPVYVLRRQQSATDLEEAMRDGHYTALAPAPTFTPPKHLNCLP